MFHWDHHYGKQKSNFWNEDIDSLLWNALIALVTDEWSTLSVSLLHRLIQAIQSKRAFIKRSRPSLFNDWDILFCGDPYQLPPIHANSLYSGCAAFLKGQPAINKHPGLIKWRPIPHSFNLSENHRFSSKYNDFLDSVRTNKITDNDLKEVSRRCIKNANVDFTKPPWCFAPLICPQNAPQMAYYIYSIVADAEAKHEPIHWIKALDHSFSIPDEYMNNIQKQNIHLSDTQTGDLPLMLPLLKGHIYNISTNIAPELHVGKTAECELINIEYAVPPHQHQNHIYPATLPLFVEVRLKEPMTEIHWPGSKDPENRTLVLQPQERTIRLP
jgi:hypothetical protein